MGAARAPARMTTTAVWRWGEVEAFGAPSALRLAHRHEGAELWLRNSRLVRGRGYESASDETRRALARTAAIVRLRARGRYFVHAAGAVDPAGRAILLAGDSGEGKSTLVYALARAGWPILGDDGVVIEGRGTETVAYAWRSPVLVSRDLAFAFPELAETDLPARAHDPRRRIAMSVPTARRARVVALFFVARGSSMQLTRMTPVAALAALVRQSPWVILGDAGARQHLAALRHVASSVPAFRFEHTADGLHAIPMAITRALASI
jgi:hypothetical protein